MIPARLAGADVRYLTSPDTGVSIPCITAKGMVFMAFEPTPEEKVAIEQGCPIWVAARGPFIPELTVRAGDKAEVIPWELQRAAVQENVPGGDEAERAIAKARLKPVDYAAGRVIQMLTVLLVLGVLGLAWKMLRG